MQMKVFRGLAYAVVAFTLIVTTIQGFPARANFGCSGGCGTGGSCSEGCTCSWDEPTINTCVSNQ